MPIRWIRGVNRTVGLPAVQRAVCGECQVEPAFPSILQPAFSTELMPTADRFTMLRSNAEGNHSGWSFHEPRDVGGGLLSLYEAATINAAIAPFLALPVGSVVKRDGDGLSVCIEGRHISSGSSDLLSRLAGKESFESVTSRLAAND